ncbi:hypothetical protein [Listeria seeligeri]|uniref:hypothetical protein n=1 Tax=Listeria seeligeri TaxID=1640 RepID=UPI0031CCCBA5
MSKYNSEITQTKQLLSGQQEKIRKLEVLCSKLKKKDAVIESLPVHLVELSQEFWQDKSDDILRQIIQKRQQFWKNQNATIVSITQELQAEINRASMRISDYQQDIRYYKNLKQMEEKADV